MKKGKTRDWQRNKEPNGGWVTFRKSDDSSLIDPRQLSIQVVSCFETETCGTKAVSLPSSGEKTTCMIEGSNSLASFFISPSIPTPSLISDSLFNKRISEGHESRLNLQIRNKKQ